MRWLWVTGTRKGLDDWSLDIELDRDGNGLALWLRGRPHWGFTFWYRRGSLDCAKGWHRSPGRCQCMQCVALRGGGVQGMKRWE